MERSKVADVVLWPFQIVYNGGWTKFHGTPKTPLRLSHGPLDRGKTEKGTCNGKWRERIVISDGSSAQGHCQSSF